MLEKLIHAIVERIDAIIQATLFASIGAAMAASQLLMSDERQPLRIVIGRCLSSAGIAMAAGVVLLIYPEAPTLAQFGVAAALGSLGTAGIERLIQRAIGGRGGA